MFDNLFLLFCVAVGASTLDGYTTYKIFRFGGREASPFPKLVYHRIGLVWGSVVLCAITYILISLVYYISLLVQSMSPLLIIIAITVAPAAWNTITILTHSFETGFSDA